MHRRNSFLSPAFCCLFAATVLLAGFQQARTQTTAAASAQTPVSPVSSERLTGHTASKVLDGTAIRVSHYNSEQKLRLALGIQPPDVAGEEKFIKELTTKGSPNFHKFLSADEWNARFGPSVEDEQKVVDWAQSVGLTVTKRYSNRLLVDVEAPAGVIEQVFGVTINNYKVGEEVDFANDSDPLMPASLSGILQTVAGLNNIERLHRLGSSKKTVKGADYVPGPVVSEGWNSHGDGDPTKAPVARAAARKAAESASNASAFNLAPKDSFPLDAGVADPDNIQSSEGYDFNAFQRLSHCCNVHNDSGGSPNVSSIALVGYGDYNYTDATTFFNYYGFAWNLNTYCIGGGSCPAVDGEAPLDVEYSDAMSNSYGSYLDTAHIYEYEITNDYWTSYEDAFNQIVSDNYAKVVSTSYGGQEATSGASNSYETGTMHNIFSSMVGEGWTLIAASGDNGASDGCGNATAVDWPSSDPYFIAAGGTQLLLDSNGI